MDALQRLQNIEKLQQENKIKIAKIEQSLDQEKEVLKSKLADLDAEDISEADLPNIITKLKTEIEEGLVKCETALKIS